MNDDIADAVAALGGMPPHLAVIDLIEAQMHALQLAR